jgi:hypothetical protein
VAALGIFLARTAPVELLQQLAHATGGTGGSGSA